MVIILLCPYSRLRVFCVSFLALLLLLIFGMGWGLAFALFFSLGVGRRKLCLIFSQLFILEISPKLIFFLSSTHTCSGQALDHPVQRPGSFPPACLCTHSHLCLDRPSLCPWGSPIFLGLLWITTSVSLSCSPASPISRFSRHAHGSLQLLQKA